MGFQGGGFKVEASGVQGRLKAFRAKANLVHAPLRSLFKGETRSNWGGGVLQMF